MDKETNISNQSSSDLLQIAKTEAETFKVLAETGKALAENQKVLAECARELIEILKNDLKEMHKNEKDK